METAILEELGLTESEVKVFLALLKLGPTKAGEVVDKSGLQNPVVHRAFHTLIEKGIITYSIEGKIKLYSAIDPSLLMDILEEKKKRLQNLIPELKKIHQEKKGETHATIHQGKKAIRKLLNNMLDKDNREFLSYGAARQSEEVLGDFFWQAMNVRRKREKTKTKMIFHTSLKTRAKELNNLPFMEVKTTDKDFEEIVETFIVGEQVAVIISSDNPVAVLIEEPLVARSYKKFFNLLWKQAEKV